jgi:hypothetical protein
MKAVEEFAHKSATGDGSPGALALAEGFAYYGGVFQTAFDVSNGTVEAIGGPLGFTVNEKIMGKVSGFFNAVGLIASTISILDAVHSGDGAAVLSNSLRVCHNLIMGSKVVASFSNPGLTASMVVVTLGDFAINLVGEKAIEAKVELYADAYKIAYSRGQAFHRQLRHWFEKIYPIVTGPGNDKEKTDAIKKLFDDYCEAFFWDGGLFEGRTDILLERGVALEEANKRYRFSSYPALTQAQRNSITAAKKWEMYNKLPAILAAVKKRIRMENEELLRREAMAMEAYVNRAARLKIVPSATGQHQGYKFQIGPLKDGVNKDLWRETLGKDGFTVRFTLQAFMESGWPNRVYVYAPDADLDKDDPVLTTPAFILNEPPEETVVTLGPVPTVTIADPREAEYKIANAGDTTKHTFKATATPDDTYDFGWDFGDGQTETVKGAPSSEVTHEYKGEGDWKPTVTLYKDGQEVASDSITVGVELLEVTVTIADPFPVYEISSETQKVPHTYRATAKPEGQYTFIWEFYDGQTYEEKNVKTSSAAHDYSGEGRKSVAVKVYLDDVEAAGARAYVQLKLKEEPVPKAAGLIAVSQDKMAWAEAKAFCRQHGGKLPRINGQDSMEDVLSSFSMFGRMLGAGNSRFKLDGLGGEGDSWPSGLPTGLFWTGTTQMGEKGGKLPLLFLRNDGPMIIISPFSFLADDSGKLSAPAVCVP